MREDPAQSSVLERAGHRVRARDEQQHEQRVGVVEAEHQRGDRSEREHRAREQRGAGENQRFTAAKSSPTAATPSSAWGTSTLHAFTPKTRPEISMTHSDAGVLSTVTKFDASVDPKKNAFQLFVPACTAAE